MKKLLSLILLTALLSGATNAWGQKDSRRIFVNFGASFQDPGSKKDELAGKGYGGFLSVGRNNILLAGNKAHLCLDTGLDLSYFASPYNSMPGRYLIATETSKDRFKNIGLLLGVSGELKINSLWSLQPYFRVSPTVSWYDNTLWERGGNGLGIYCIPGLALSWRLLSVGGEWRWGRNNYKDSADIKSKYEFDALRVYIGIRF